MPTQAQAPVEDEWRRFDPDAGQALRRIRMIFEDFVAALRAGRAPMVDGTEGRKAVELILAIYRSAKLGRTVRLPL